MFWSSESECHSQSRHCEQTRRGFEGASPSDVFFLDGITFKDVNKKFEKHFPKPSLPGLTSGFGVAHFLKTDNTDKTYFCRAIRVASCLYF